MTEPATTDEPKILGALDRWLRYHNLSRYEFAKRYRISQPFVSQLINGRKKASPKMAEYIERITGISKKLIRPDLYGAD